MCKTSKLIVLLTLILIITFGNANAASVIALNPNANTHNATRIANLVVTFDGNVDALSVNDTTFMIHRGFEDNPIGAFSVTGNDITFNPTYDFYPGELIQTTITTNITLNGGTLLDNPYVWQFRVGVNSGSAFFVDNGESYGTSSSYAMSLGDLDGDGDLDAFVANYNGEKNKVWLNDGNGTFTVSTEDYGNSSWSDDISLGDLDNDGDLDVFVANYSGQTNTVWLNDGDGTFTGGGNYGTSKSYGISLGDLDGDGDLDAFVANVGQANKVWLNNGDGTFIDNGESYGTSSSRDISLGDLDGDGDLDVFVANDNNQANKVWLNDGDGTFTDSGESYGTSKSFGIGLGDLDNDGDLDAFVSNYSGQANKVWLNNGDGTFTDSGEGYGSSDSHSMSLGDLDGDGDLDVFVSNFAANKVWLNDGDGTFTNSGENYGSSNSKGISLGDLDGDGDLDAFMGNNGEANKVWLNNNSPIITSTPPDSAMQGVLYTYQVIASDVDNDTLYYHLLIHPNGMTIDINTGLIEWTPADTNIGNYNISLEVTESHSGTGTMQDYVLYVYPNTSVSLFDLPELPNEFDLSQNYPNPFNPETTIKYQLPESNNVILNIYNVKGQLVKILVNEIQNTGYYNITWNGTDNSGKEIASGLYIYRLSVGNYIETKKMLLLK